MCSFFHARLRTATLRRNEEGQASLINLLLRNYLHYNLYDQVKGSHYNQVLTLSYQQYGGSLLNLRFFISLPQDSPSCSSLLLSHVAIPLSCSSLSPVITCGYPSLMFLPLTCDHMWLSLKLRILYLYSIG